MKLTAWIGWQHMLLFEICKNNSSNNSILCLWVARCNNNIYHLLVVVNGRPYWPREKQEVLMTHMAVFSFLISHVIIWIEILLNSTPPSQIPMNNKDTMRPPNQTSFESSHKNTKSSQPFLIFNLFSSTVLVIYHHLLYPVQNIQMCVKTKCCIFTPL